MLTDEERARTREENIGGKKRGETSYSLEVEGGVTGGFCTRIIHL